MKRSYRRQTTSNVELTPLIDVIFILIIFFAVSTTFLSHHSVLELTLPSITQDQQTKSPVKIQVDKHNQIYVNNQKTTLAKVSSIINLATQSNTDTPIELLIDESIPYQRVVILLSKIQNSGYHQILLKGIFDPNG